MQRRPHPLCGRRTHICGFDGGTVAERVKNEKGNFGFDAAAGEFGDLVERGVIDPAKVVITALTNAASITAMLLSTDVLIAEERAHDHHHAGGHDHAHGGHSHGGGMGGMF